MKFDYIVDSHCHLDLLEKKGENIPDIINESLENNVKILQTICTRISQLDDILEYSNEYDFIYASAGIHPCNVLDEKLYLADEIVKICAQNNKIIGIGETGLDYYHDKSGIEKQKISFLEHIKASQENNLPLINHSRDGDVDMA